MEQLEAEQAEAEDELKKDLWCQHVSGFGSAVSLCLDRSLFKRNLPS